MQKHHKKIKHHKSLHIHSQMINKSSSFACFAFALTSGWLINSFNLSCNVIMQEWATIAHKFNNSNNNNNMRITIDTEPKENPSFESKLEKESKVHLRVTRPWTMSHVTKYFYFKPLTVVRLYGPYFSYLGGSALSTLYVRNILTLSCNIIPCSVVVHLSFDIRVKILSRSGRVC